MDSPNLLFGSISSETDAPEGLTRVGPMSTMARFRFGGACGLHPGHVDPRIKSGRFKRLPPRDRIPKFPKRPCIDAGVGRIGVGKIPGGVNGSFVFRSAIRALIKATLSWICF